MEREAKIQWFHQHLNSEPLSLEDTMKWLTHVAQNHANFCRWFQFNIICSTTGPKQSLWCEIDTEMLSRPSELILDMKGSPPMTDDEKEFYGDFGERLLYFIIANRFGKNWINLKRIVVVGSDDEPFKINGLHITALFTCFIATEHKVVLEELHVECHDLHVYLGKFVLEDFLSQQTTLKKLNLKIHGAIVNRFLGTVSKNLLNHVSLDFLSIQSESITLRGLSKILAGKNTKRVKHLTLHLPMSMKCVEEFAKLLRHPSCTIHSLNVKNLNHDRILCDISQGMKEVLKSSMKDNANCVKLNGVDIYSD